MKNILIVCCLFVFVLGCQRDVVVPPQPSPNITVNPSQPAPGVIVGPPVTPGVHIDVGPRPGYVWCNGCNAWVHVGHHHH